MKKTLIIIFSLFIAFTTNFANAAEGGKIAVFPADETGSSYAIFPDAVIIVANDVANALRRDYKFNIADISANRDQIRSERLERKYHRLLRDYKSTDTIDKDLCDMFAQMFGADKILFVSGGFDLQNMFLKRTIFFHFDIPGSSQVRSSYRLNTFMTLVDVKSGDVLWEGTYAKDFDVSAFSMPSRYAIDNVVSAQKVRNYSALLSKKVSLDIAKALATSEITEVSGNVISTDGVKSQNATESQAKEGIGTKDGHFYSTKSDYLLNSRKEKFKNWIKLNLP